MASPTWLVLLWKLHLHQISGNFSKLLWKTQHKNKQYDFINLFGMHTQLLFLGLFQTNISVFLMAIRWVTWLASWSKFQLRELECDVNFVNCLLGCLLCLSPLRITYWTFHVVYLTMELLLRVVIFSLWQKQNVCFMKVKSQMLLTYYIKICTIRPAMIEKSVYVSSKCHLISYQNGSLQQVLCSYIFQCQKYVSCGIIFNSSFFAPFSFSWYYFMFPHHVFGRLQVCCPFSRYVSLSFIIIHLKLLS